MKSFFSLALALCGAVLLTGCPDTGIICQAGTVRCGQGCVDSNADAKNCGGCGSACRSGEVCSAAACVCAAGTFSCNGECVVRDNDVKNCGACGKACAMGEVCEAGACKLGCTASPTSTLCGTSCVNFGTDAMNCGACNVKCENSQSCHAGRCTYDLVAACFSSGQVVGLQASTEFRGPAEALGTAPQSLAALNGVLLSLDGIDQRLYQARLRSVGGRAFAKLLEENKTGSAPNQVVVDGQRVYVVNSASGTLQVLGAPTVNVDGGGEVGDAGISGGQALTTLSEINLGANTYPQGLAKVGNNAWIPLYGGFGAANAGAGQKVVRVDVTDPTLPIVRETIDLSTLNLKPFDGGSPVARPYAILARNGNVYVALNNLNATTYVPEGPGLLAKIDLLSKAVTVIDLGGDKCLNPGWLASDGVNLLVSCLGAAEYSGAPDFALLRTAKSGVVLLDTNDQRRGTWEPSCPAGADGGPGCTPILPSRFTVSNGRAYVGDQNGGRVFVLDIVGTQLVERRGYFGDAGLPISACAPDPVTGIANVSDVFAVP